MPSEQGPADSANIHAQWEQLQCQLLSLEVTLQNAAKARLVPEAVYQPRLDYVQKLRLRLGQLKALMEETQLSDVDEDLGFPNLAHCSSEEIRVCDAFISYRLQSAQDLYNLLHKLHTWISASFSGKGSFLAIFRLAKLKKWLQAVENEHIKTDVEEKELDRVLQKMASNIENHNGSLHLTGNLEALVRLYRDIDGLNNRIAGLRTSLARHEEHIKELRQWLTENEPSAKRQTPTELPTLKHLEEAKQSIADHSIYPAADTEKRLTLARNFVKSCLKEENNAEPPHPSTLAKSEEDSSHAN